MRFPRRAVSVVAGLAATLVASTAVAQAPARWDTTVLAHVQSPGYPAFAYSHPNKRVYVGTYANPTGDSIPSRVVEYTRSGTLRRSWIVPKQDLTVEHGVQAAVSDHRGRMIVLEKSLARVWQLDLTTGHWRTYAQLRDLPDCVGAPDGTCSPSQSDAPAIPNYAAWGRHGALYITDYGQAVIWKVPPHGGRAKVWYADSRLDGGQFGTAGLLYDPARRALLITQQTSLGTPDSTQGSLFVLPIRKGQPGDLSTLWTSQPSDLPDGFGLARSGNLYISNAGLTQQIAVVGPDGTELERFPTTPGTGDNGSSVPFDTPSSATFAGSRILVANQSFFGQTANHAVLSVFVGERGVPTFIPRSAG